MSNFNDKHHDSTRATLFDAFYEAQTPKEQKRLNDWMLVVAASFRMGEGHPTTADTALEMARAFLWSLFSKDMKQFTEVLKG